MPTPMQASYNPLAKFFHWAVVLAVLIQYGSVLLLDEDSGSSSIINFHMSFGIVILVLMLARLLWRLSTTVPPHDPTMPWWQSLASSATHFGLYALLTAMPLIGWLWTSALQWQVVVFGILPLPFLISYSENLAEILGELHEITGTLILCLIGLHIAAALYHWIIVKDGVMQRMLP